jgi:hypothetical protein
LRCRSPTITRKTDKGLPRYYDVEESDEYILSGAEDLVPNRKADGSLDVLSRPDRVVQQYRPRSEGLFARIERHTMAADGSVHWEVTTKDNVTHVYGRSNATTFQGRDLPCFAMNAIFQLHLQRLTWASSSKHFDAAYADFSVRGSREAPSVELPGRTEMNVGERSVSELPRLSERARSSWVTGSTSPIQTSQRATLSVVRTSPSCRRESCSPPAWAHRMRQWGSSTPTCTRRKFGGQRKAGESI